jgi:diguanylate cyclase (GGDEF)-like protein
MNTPFNELMFASAALAAAAAAMTAFGLRRQRFAGWLWWVAAMWLTTLGTLLGALLPGRTGGLLATPLLLQWPLMTLVGLRRFQARQSWPGSEHMDWCVLVLAVAGATVGGLLADANGANGASLLAACSMLVHVYAAAVLIMAPTGRDSTPVQGLAAVMALAAFLPGLIGLPEAEFALSLQARAAAAALGAIVLASVAQTLVCERTERQLRESRRRLRTLANLDALTQVPNRRHFHELASMALAQDAPGSAVLLMFDVDHFKQINDNMGHAAGDRALCLVSGSVLEHLRTPDVAGRHGGDEFVLLLRRAGTRDAMGVAARIVAEVQRRTAENRLPPLSLSFGLVQIGADEMLDSALRRADQALYEAKRQGRSRAVSARGDEAKPIFSESQRLGLTTL